MAINEGFLQELKYKTDIEDIVSSYVTLRKRGNTSVGLCPFHNEKTPSFTVYNDTQSFYCFGCGAGGDAVRFIRLIENLDYVDAVKLLAQRAGMQMPDEGFDDSLSKRRRKILEINREAAKFYHNYMMSPEGKTGLDYFLTRGLTKNSITKFGLGYAPDEWDALLKHLKGLGYKISEMVDAGVVKLSRKNTYYDTFKNRAMFPIIDVRGNVVGFSGRRIVDDSSPHKYVNTADTLVYKKTNELYGMNFAKDNAKDNLILCEGNMDVISMHQAGFTNAVAGCGTALTNEQVRLISRYTNEVILIYDSDEAGQKALNKSIALFKQTDLKIKVPRLTGGKDPDEIIQKLGRDKFKGMLEGASNDIEFELLKVREKHDISTTQGKIDYINDAIRVLSPVSPVEQDLYMTRLSDELGVEKSSIKVQLDNYTESRLKRERNSKYKSIVDKSVRDNVRQQYDTGTATRKFKAEERIIGLLLKYPDCKSLCDGIDAQKLTGGFIAKAYTLITERLNNGLDVDLINFGDSLTNDEYGRLSGIIARTGTSKDAKKEIADCIEVINSEFDKSNSDSSKISDDDEFRKMFDKK